MRILVACICLLVFQIHAEDCWCNRGAVADLEQKVAQQEKELAELRNTMRLVLKSNPELLAKAQAAAREEVDQAKKDAAENQRKSETIQEVVGRFIYMQNGATYETNDPATVAKWKAGTRVQWLRMDAAGKELPPGCYFLQDPKTNTSVRAAYIQPQE